MPVYTEVWTCLICGADHKTKIGAETCEKKGMPAMKYQGGERVVYEGMEASIDGRGIDENTHEPWYRIRLEQDKFDGQLIHAVREHELKPKN